MRRPITVSETRPSVAIACDQSWSEEPSGLISSMSADLPRFATSGSIGPSGKLERRASLSSDMNAIIRAVQKILTTSVRDSWDYDCERDAWLRRQRPRNLSLLQLTSHSIKRDRMNHGPLALTLFVSQHPSRHSSLVCGAGAWRLIRARHLYTRIPKTVLVATVRCYSDVRILIGILRSRSPMRTVVVPPGRFPAVVDQLAYSGSTTINTCAR